MATYRFLAYSIQRTLKQTMKDASITIPQIVNWIQFSANQIKGQHIKKTESGAFLTIIENVPVQNSSFGGQIVLPRVIFDIENDRGVDFVYYDNNGVLVPFSRVLAGEAWRLNLDMYEKPTMQNPVFFREHQSLHLLGIDGTIVNKVILGIFDTIDFFNIIKDLDAQIDVNEENIPVIERQVLELARFGLIVVKDRINEGTDLTPLLNQTKQTAKSTKDE